MAALVNDGYGAEKAERRVTAAILSQQIIRCPDAENYPDQWISIYCPIHWERWKKELSDVEIIPVKINRDGRPVPIKN